MLSIWMIGSYTSCAIIAKWNLITKSQNKLHENEFNDKYMTSIVVTNGHRTAAATSITGRSWAQIKEKSAYFKYHFRKNVSAGSWLMVSKHRVFIMNIALRFFMINTWVRAEYLCCIVVTLFHTALYPPIRCEFCLAAKMKNTSKPNLQINAKNVVNLMCIIQLLVRILILEYLRFFVSFLFIRFFSWSLDKN